MAAEYAPQAATNGNVYVPYNQRTGNESIVYFTRDLSARGLQKVYERVGENIYGKVAVKVHTGEPHGPNIIPRDWVKSLIKKEFPSAHIVETNTYYEGGRYTTEEHRKTLKTNGWTFCPVDILDDDGYTLWPVIGGKWFNEMAIGVNLVNYDSMVVLTHFKGHTVGGFGGSNKNIGIGCATGKEGKKWIHTVLGSDNLWSIDKEELGERFTESTKSVVDHFGENIVYVNAMRNMSVSCDCEGVEAMPVVTPNVGILASTDICAIDTACVDIIYALPKRQREAMVERIESRHGHGQLSYMKSLGMGNNRYILVDVDNNDVRIDARVAAASAVPFKATPSRTATKAKTTGAAKSTNAKTASAKTASATKSAKTTKATKPATTKPKTTKTSKAATPKSSKGRGTKSTKAKKS